MTEMLRLRQEQSPGEWSEFNHTQEEKGFTLNEEAWMQNPTDSRAMREAQWGDDAAAAEEARLIGDDGPLMEEMDRASFDSLVTKCETLKLQIRMARVRATMSLNEARRLLSLHMGKDARGELAACSDALAEMGRLENELYRGEAKEEASPSTQCKP